MVKNVVTYNLHENEHGISFSLRVKPKNRLSSANMITVLRNAIAKLEDME